MQDQPLDNPGEAKGYVDPAQDTCPEEKALRSQRLESIGLLAAGISHDLNNIFSPLLVAVPILREWAPDGESSKMLDMIEQNITRGAGLVRQLIDFAKGSGSRHRSVPTAQLLSEVAYVIRETFPKNIELETGIATDLWTITGDYTQIYQVLLNLCINARDAMAKGGVLRLSAENGRADDRTNEAPQPESWVILQVEDTGTGIPPDVLDRMWEPFYTTKGEAKGTGLGLSTVRSIVGHHRGFVDVRTKIGHGTLFRVRLPAFAEDDGAGRPAGGR